MPAMACLSRLAVASVNTHRTRWPTPTPTQTRSYIHLCTQMYNPPRSPPRPLSRFPLLLRTELPFSFRPSFNPPWSRQPLGLHGHRTSSLLSRRPGVPTFLPAGLNFAKAALVPLMIILRRKFQRIWINRAYVLRLVEHTRLFHFIFF